MESNKTIKISMSRDEWERIGKTAGWSVESKKKKKKKDWDPNPWAVCTESVGRDNPEKYERCVKHVKEKQ